MHPDSTRHDVIIALTALNRGDDRANALRAMMAKVLAMEEPRRWYTASMSGLDVRYDLGEGHPMLGRRVPDLDLVAAGGLLRLFELLHEAQPVLLGLGRPGRLDIRGWRDRVKVVDAACAGRIELPVVGAVDTPVAVLVRPDGHVAWVGGEDGDAGLALALKTWFGEPGP
jgi:hypothetical protein